MAYPDNNTSIFKRVYAVPGNGSRASTSFSFYLKSTRYAEALRLDFEGVNGVNRSRYPPRYIDRESPSIHFLSHVSNWHSRQAVIAQ